MWGTLVAIGTPPVIAVADGAVTGSFDPTALIGTFITPVIVIVLILWGKLRTEAEVNRLVADNESLRVQVREKDHQLEELQNKMTDRVMPAVTKSAIVLEHLTPLLQHNRLLPPVLDE